VFIHDVLAGNLRAFRLLRSLEQGEVATRMNRLGHEWRRATVSHAERGHRNVTVAELVSLTLVLDVTVAQLLDPRGPERREGPDLALVSGVALSPVGSDEVIADNVTLVLPASEVTALVCSHELTKRSTWAGSSLEAIQLDDAEVKAAQP